ncbi:MAG: IS3 family transposase [Mycobacteriales bacterium]
MKRRRHTPEQVIRKLVAGEKRLAEGQELASVCRELEITESTWHRWRNQYGGMKVEDAKRLKELERENGRLKKIVAEQVLDIDMLRELSPGKLLTPDRRRRAVAALQARFGVSERRACRVAGQPRSTQRLAPASPADEELALRGFLREFARARPRWGWRRAATAARAAGWVVNNKRIHRLWRVEGLRVPYRKRKRPLRGIGVPVGAFCPIRPNVVWACDFQFDQTADGRMLKLLNVIDEFTRECLAIEVDRSIDADGVVACLDRLAASRGAPAYLRFDHGPEFIAYAVADWCRLNGATTVFIDPGSPWQNAWVESFNGRLRDEYLNSQRFDTLAEARVLLEDWRIDYNRHRPHSAHDWLTPEAFLEAWTDHYQLALA